MKRSRFTEEQIIGVLREHEAGVKTGDLCRKRGISGATFFKWKPARCHSGDEHQPALGLDHRRQLARSLRASHWQIFWKVQFPAALPFVFSGAKVPITLAVIGAVIGEFVGSVNGLGNLLLSANSQLNGPLVWTALVWLSILGVVLLGALALQERLTMPWARIGHH